jgi:hypothetical protein
MGWWWAWVALCAAASLAWLPLTVGQFAEGDDIGGLITAGLVVLFAALASLPFVLGH